MILDKKVKVKINKKNIVHYSNFFNNLSLKDVIEIITEIHLMKNSNLKINVECDICNIKRFIKYQSYTKNINSCKDYPIYTCDKCSHIKLKNTNIKKYGVEYYSKTREYSEKFKSSMMEKYGVEHALQNQYLKDKAKKTNLEKLGVENPFQSEEIKEKIKQSVSHKYGYTHIQSVPEIRNRIKKTNLKKYGVEYPFQSEEIRKKSIKTNLDKFGVSIFAKSEKYITSVKKTNLEKYGVEWVLQSQSIRDDISKTNLLKLGVDNPMKSEIIRRNLIISNDPSYIKYLDSSISLFKCVDGHDFEMHIDIYHSRRKNGIDLCTVCNPIGDSRSIKENEVYEFISEIYKGEVVKTYRDVLEIDIYLPELKIGFEFNGLYWHSEEFKDKNYHLDKTKYFQEKGIRIIHIWEDDWIFKKDIIKSQIKNWIGVSDRRIFGRKCIVQEIHDTKLVRQFLDQNHIQGYVISNLNIGLFHNRELISLMIFDHLEGRKKMLSSEWNLSRFCNKLDTNIIGGASKLFKYFLRNYNHSRIISYADRNWSQGDLYHRLKFNHVSDGKPDYKYVIDNKRIHKSRFRKSNLQTDVSESKFMNLSGIYKIYDCGKIKFEFNI